MPAAKPLPEVEHFEPVKPSEETIDFVKLLSVDLSKYDDGIEARKELAGIVKLAMTTKGFFTLLNHGIIEEEITRQVVSDSCCTNTDLSFLSSSRDARAWYFLHVVPNLDHPLRYPRFTVSEYR